MMSAVARKKETKLSETCTLSYVKRKRCLTEAFSKALTSIVADKNELQYMYEETAYSLASDRSTKSLPVFFAETIFIGGWILALLKAASSDPSPSNWVPVEAHSVAFSGLYLWVTSAVIIGVCQK
jgi:hypothetical protein